jgi:hypothetical protein
LRRYTVELAIAVDLRQGDAHFTVATADEHMTRR